MFAAMSVIWGLPYLLIKVADGGVPVPVLVLARVSLGAALLLPIALRRKQFAAIRPVWPWLALFAVVEIILPWYALSEAERGISSSLTGLLVASVPIIVAVLSLFLRGGDRLSPIRWTGLLIGLGGVALLAGPNLIGSGATSGTARSVAEVLFVALCYATGPLIANRKLTNVPPVAMTAACLALASVVYAPLAALNWPSAVPAGQGTARARGAGRDLHGGGVPDLLPADRRGRAGQGQRDYLHQPGDRRITRRGRARRACDASHAGRVRDDPGRFRAGDQASAWSGSSRPGGAGT